MLAGAACPGAIVPVGRVASPSPDLSGLAYETIYGGSTGASSGSTRRSGRGHLPRDSVELASCGERSASMNCQRGGHVSIAAPPFPEPPPLPVPLQKVGLQVSSWSGQTWCRLTRIRPLRQGHLRQDGGAPARQHGLARSGWTQEQEIMVKTPASASLSHQPPGGS